MFPRLHQLGLPLRIAALGCTAVLLMGRHPAAAQSVSPEPRGVWLDKGQLVEGRDRLARRFDRLKAAGFNVVYVAVQVRGTVTYPGSAILPQYEPIRAADPEVVAWAIDALHERGMRAEAWAEFGFYAYWTKDASTDASRGVILDREPELAAVDRNGKTLIHNPEYGDFYALCPANPRAQDVLIDLYAEVLERLPFDGLHLDRIRFPDDGFCFCAHCRQRFEQETHAPLTTVDETAEQRGRRDTWRKQQTGRFVERLSGALRQRFPRRSLSAAVVPPYMMDEKGQDWPAWLERGWVDSVAVMLYGEQIDEGLEAVHKRLPDTSAVYIGLDAGLGASRLSTQVEAVRTHRYGGVVIWYAAPLDPLLEELQKTVFSSPHPGRATP